MVKTPLFPEYHKVKLLLQALEGIEASLFQAMLNSIWAATGTPQKRVSWTEPDQWIPQRLKGKEALLAQRIWAESRGKVNPRHVRGCKFLIDNYELLSLHKGEYAITPAGRVFMGEEPNEASAHIDVEEGLVFLLYRLSIHGRGKRSTFHEEWKEYLLKNSNYRTRKTINTSLSQRLRNLVSRGLANREGNQYSLSEKGQHYLQNFDQNSSFSSLNEEEDLSHQIDSFNQQQRDALYKRLQEMDPIRFEHTIKDLLLALGYEDVVVTSPTNDKGVDVTGTIQKGISSIKEVIQVKRNTTAAVSRRVMDGLRGSLYRFDAFQGTIITLSDFTKGTVQSALDRGAAPITLINGQKLLDLLIENGIGINRHKAEFFTVDPDYFTTEEVDDIEDERE